MGFDPILVPQTWNHVWTHDPAADEVFSLFRFPVGGRVLNAYATNTATVVASGSGTNYFALYLAKYSNAATPVVQGTLGSWTAASPWGVDIPRTMTVTSFGSTALFAAGEWVRLVYDENDLGVFTEMGMQIDYVLGADVGVTPTIAAAPSED